MPLTEREQGLSKALNESLGRTDAAERIASALGPVVTATEEPGTGTSQSTAEWPGDDGAGHLYFKEI